MSRVTVLAESCKGVEDCGLCLEECPADVFEPAGQSNARGYLPAFAAREDACTGCEACMRICPDFAVIVKAKRSSGKEVGDA
ncbi:MAG: ferredoxin family protein [Desulfovibrio sp.]|jgi:2-oxoglutarate ferredoxin oxidoreductase subunit delta|nr:ferredoxin family protein [Desulfovibrio sp.]